jgi:hypothetical protein
MRTKKSVKHFIFGKPIPCAGAGIGRKPCINAS